eukprot:4519153-Lingulodinium_polyedra.AAC.1
MAQRRANFKIKGYGNALGSNADSMFDDLEQKAEQMGFAFAVKKSKHQCARARDRCGNTPRGE